MLGTLEKEQKTDWKHYINSLVNAYNCIPHDSTGFLPHELMFGRKPKLPIDAVFEKSREEFGNKSTYEYMEDLRSRMKTTQQIV